VIADAGGPDYQQRAQPSSHPSAACSPRRGAPASRLYADRCPQARRQRAPEVAAARHGRQLERRDRLGLAPEPGDVVLGKQTYSPFLNPEFERTLESGG